MNDLGFKKKKIWARLQNGSLIAIISGLVKSLLPYPILSQSIDTLAPMKECEFVGLLSSLISLIDPMW